MARHADSPAPHSHRRRRRTLRWVLPAVLVLAWVVIGGIGGPFAGKLGDVQENDNASFLPTDAEATQVQRLQKKFVEQQTDPAIVLYERDGPITAADRSAARADATAIGELDAVVGKVAGPLPSEDGQALELIVPLNGNLGSELVDVVCTVRAEVDDGPVGLTAYVTGPAGLAADFVDAFAGIDGILLGVAVAVVLLILVVVYRSPILPFVVLLSALFSLSVASAAIYALASNDLLTLNGQSQGILFILVVGAATDYALLLVARFREELREYESRFDAMRVAFRQSFEPILASGTTVILAVLCLLFSNLNSTRGLGPVGAIGIAASLISAFTFLPAVLALLGRAAFWPRRPQFESDHRLDRGVWARVSGVVRARPRRIWVGTAVVLAAAAAFLPTFSASGVPQTDLFLSQEESVTGQAAAAEHFPAGAGSPAVIVGPADRLDRIEATARGVDGIASATATSTGDRPGTGDPSQAAPDPKVVDGLVEVEATLSEAADSAAGEDTVNALRSAIHDAVPGAKVGGVTAIQIDTNDNARRDLVTIIPIVLGVILVVLCLLLRAVLAPVLLVLSVVLSFAATLGVSALVFDHLLGFPGADPSVPLYGFVFIVALGIDYNIFLMTRVREESSRHGTRSGILRGLTVTGGVITSAGIVLAATFSALSVIPILFLAQIAFIVAFGVLLDTFLVRSLLVPALAYDIDGRIWWPGRLAASTQWREPRREPGHKPG